MKFNLRGPREKEPEKKFINPTTGSEFTVVGIRTMLSDIEQLGKGLTSWEESFVSSITDQFETTSSISEKQLEILERIYTYKTPCL